MCRYGLAIGYYCAWLVRLLMAATSPISWPIGKLLDFLLGAEHRALFRWVGIGGGGVCSSSNNLSSGFRLGAGSIRPWVGLVVVCWQAGVCWNTKPVGRKHSLGVQGGGGMANACQSM